ncbi:MAG: metallophosphoesterase [Rhodospirillales bacterium]|nr:metallophosphoesterase [Rhodospirillales bacterium]MCB9973270.1 metallophosphoesterase [Rhodospirillales bacterium]MCB9980592.1 metallophosphoesterase [Rhodospirillales bacterium]
MKDYTPSQWMYFAPDQTVLYAIGDLHGYLEPHNMLYARLELEAGKREDLQHIVIYLGDYIDRGPDSAQLIEKLLRLKRSDGLIQHRFLMGNHEAGLLDYLEDPHGAARWLEFGGIETAESYGISFNKRLVLPAERENLQQALLRYIPKEHLDFYRSLEPIVTFGDYVFVHAGIRPDIPLHQQDPKDLRFIREPFLSWDQPHEKCIVHGHSISKKPDIKSNRIGLDTGYFQNRVLSCGIFEKNSVKILQIDEND